MRKKLRHWTNKLIMQREKLSKVQYSRDHCTVAYNCMYVRLDHFFIFVLGTKTLFQSNLVKWKKKN